jgi:hypothetical protein
MSKALRKTIVTLANQMQKNEHDRSDPTGFPQIASPPPTMFPQVSPPGDGNLQMPYIFPDLLNNMQNLTPFMPQPKIEAPHMVWDPAKRSLVSVSGKIQCEMPIQNFTPRNQRKKESKGRNKNRRDGLNNGKLISPFPRRYTSSHLPRYRRKFEISEKNRYENQNAI